MIAALNHDTLPPTLHVDAPSPHIDWSAGTVRLLTEAVPWPVTDHPRTAAVSSFGISGTNAHVIVQQAPNKPPWPRHNRCQSRPHDRPRCWCGRSRRAAPTALAAQADRLHQHLIEHPDLELTDVAYSLATTRAHHPYRAAITAHRRCRGSAPGAAGCPGCVDRRPAPPPVDPASRCCTPAGKTVFVLPGQGAQYPGMGLDLYRHHRSFARTLDEVCEALDPHLEVPLREVMFAEPDSAVGELLHQTGYAQPALFAMGVAMHALFAEAGINPDYLLGPFHRGTDRRLYRRCVLPCRRRGVGARSWPADASLCSRRDDRHRGQRTRRGGPARRSPHDGIAAINGPTSVVVSGPPDELDRIRDHCAAHDLRVSSLSVSHAFHSPSMDPALPEFEAIAAGLTFASPTVPILSNLTGELPPPSSSPPAATGPDTCVSRSGSMTVWPSFWPPVSTRLWSCRRTRCWPRRSPTPWPGLRSGPARW